MSRTSADRRAGAPLSLELIRTRLHASVELSRVSILQRFFKTGPGEYAEGDRFIGVTVPSLRQVCRECRGAPLKHASALLKSPIHEERLLALLLLVDAYKVGDDRRKREIYLLYLSETKFINNWDLVDTSAPPIVGAWLFDKSRAPLARLARSASLWERRIAIVATQYFVRQHQFDDTFSIADILLADAHDL